LPASTCPMNTVVYHVCVNIRAGEDGGVK
jgi:hypothetical protein